MVSPLQSFENDTPNRLPQPYNIHLSILFHPVKRTRPHTFTCSFRLRITGFGFSAFLFFSCICLSCVVYVPFPVVFRVIIYLTAAEREEPKTIK